MENYNRLGFGSRGSEVTELQLLLNKNGYNLSVNGGYDSKTLSAVRDFKTKNNLSDDGVVDNGVWNLLRGKNGSNSAGNASNGSTTKPTTGGFVFSKQAGWDEIMKKILNREKFSYDMNADALYHQYKDQAVTMGQQAAMDTMGMAQAATGGYGNSYAQSVGQQTYNGYIQGLNDKIPALYQLALDKYNSEGEELLNKYALYADEYGREYGEYRDAVSDSQWALDLLKGGNGNTNNEEIGNETVRNSSISIMQEFLGVTPTGKWDAASQAAATDKWGVSSVEEAFKMYQEMMRPGINDLLGGVVSSDTVTKIEKDQYGKTHASKEKVDAGTVDGQHQLRGSVIDEIKALYKAGEISMSEYKNLMKIYAPKGYTY